MIKKRNQHLGEYFVIVLLAIFAWCALGSAFAHKVTAVSVVSKFDTQARTYSVELAMDVYPSEDPETNEQVSPQQAADFFSNEALSLFFGDTQVKPKVNTEIFKDPEADLEIQEEKMKVMVTLTGKIPQDAGYFTLRVSPDTTAAVVMVIFKDGKPGRRAEVLYPGEFSSPVDVSKITEGDPFDGVETDATESKMQLRATLVEEDTTEGAADETPSVENKAIKADQSTPSLGMGYFIEIGMRSFFASEHYAAVLLVLCLFFFSQNLMFLLRQVVMLTAALSMALLLAVFGITSVMGMIGVSEILQAWMIPLGIAILAIENLFVEHLRWWRLSLIALTGFLLGTVFSVTLSVSGMSADSVGSVFGGYFLGLLLAQLLTLLVVTLVVAAFWKRSWYRRSIAIPVSLLIAGITLYWMIDQAFQGV